MAQYPYAKYQNSGLTSSCASPEMSEKALADRCIQAPQPVSTFTLSQMVLSDALRTVDRLQNLNSLLSTAASDKDRESCPAPSAINDRLQYTLQALGAANALIKDIAAYLGVEA